jgi:vacuolar protein sorting-associated protein 26
MHKELEPPGDLTHKLSFNFSFKKVNLPFDTYESNNIIIKYYLKMTIGKKLFGSKHIIEKLFIVRNSSSEPILNSDIRMELGIPNQTLFEFELFKNKYNLEDCILGRLRFERVNMKVRSIDIQLIKIESIGHGKYNRQVIPRTEL